MPFPMKIQPIDPNGAIRAADHAKPAPKSRLKRLFERQFPGVLRNSSAERLPGAGDGRERDRDGFDHEPSSVCLDKMVRSFMEDTEKPSRCGRSRCNCFHGTCDDSSDDDLDLAAADPPSSAAAPVSSAEVIKGLAVCTSVAERNLLADVSSIAEKHKSCRRKDELRRLVTDGLRSAGYDAAYEYVDVVVGGGAGEERLIVDVDFRSEFEIARSTKSYRAVLQSLPSIFVGKGDRLQQIVAVASEAAKMSLRKKGLHFPPWRNPEYMRSKWLSPFDRTYCTTPPSSPPTSPPPPPPPPPPPQQQQHQQQPQPPLIIEAEEEEEGEGDNEEEHATAPWEPPEVKPKEEAARRGAKVVTGLASVLRDIP
ncbi:hypothetical protein ACMD2_01034 [Ananas comosus]|uniref:Uncharacterized protein n=1 Tax=Ananas comosus TaxID=4615 RepID=A0A199VVG9_ANACO|nr:hypothetical protein ACMD2_01034 [Ananas comosus]